MCQRVGSSAYLPVVGGAGVVGQQFAEEARVLGQETRHYAKGWGRLPGALRVRILFLDLIFLTRVLGD